MKICSLTHTHTHPIGIPTLCPSCTPHRSVQQLTQTSDTPPYGYSMHCLCTLLCHLLASFFALLLEGGLSCTPISHHHSYAESQHHLSYHSLQHASICDTACLPSMLKPLVFSSFPACTSHLFNNHTLYTLSCERSKYSCSSDGSIACISIISHPMHKEQLDAEQPAFLTITRPCTPWPAPLLSLLCFSSFNSKST